MIHPYGDSRQCFFETVWTFDLDKDLLLFCKADKSGRLPLSVLRQRPVTFDDFESCEPPSAPTFDTHKIFPPPHWEPAFQVPERNKNFIGRILNDFNIQWRHILRNRYNDLTFRRLASAILLLATLDFKIVEVTRSRPGTSQRLVGPLDLPAWEPLQMQVMGLGRGWVVVCQDPADCISLIREHVSSQIKQTPEQSTENATYYLVLCIRHITICRAYQNKLEWARPEPFLDGSSPCSDRALELLLWVTSPRPPRSSIQMLPLEIQDRIIRYVSQGSVEVAKVGCALGLGSPFSWTDGRMTIKREQSHRNWVTYTPVESQIRFGNYMSGIAYRGDMSSLKPPYTITEVAPSVFLYT